MFSMLCSSLSSAESIIQANAGRSSHVKLYGLVENSIHACCDSFRLIIVKYYVAMAGQSES